MRFPTKLGQLLSPHPILKAGSARLIYQNIENLPMKPVPKNLRRLVFTDNYHTLPGGNRVVNRAFINFFEKARTNEHINKFHR